MTVMQTFLLVLFVLPSASGQEAIQDGQAIAVAQRANVQELDRSLRTKQSFSVWFADLIGKTTKVLWEVNDCGEATGSVADVGRDLPVCAEARAFLSQKREVVVSVVVGTMRKGILGSPALYQVILVDKNGLIRDAKTLSGLARLLEAQ